MYLVVPSMNVVWGNESRSVNTITHDAGASPRCEAQARWMSSRVADVWIRCVSRERNGHADACGIEAFDVEILRP
jgi:hypothetical protein